MEKSSTLKRKNAKQKQIKQKNVCSMLCSHTHTLRHRKQFIRCVDDVVLFFIFKNKKAKASQLVFLYAFSDDFPLRCFGFRFLAIFHQQSFHQTQFRSGHTARLLLLVNVSSSLCCCRLAYCCCPLIFLQRTRKKNVFFNNERVFN